MPKIELVLFSIAALFAYTMRRRIVGGRGILPLANAPGDVKFNPTVYPKESGEVPRDALIFANAPANAKSFVTAGGGGNRGNFRPGTGTDFFGDAAVAAVNAPLAALGFALGYIGQNLPNALQNTAAQDAHDSAMSLNSFRNVFAAPVNFAMNMLRSDFGRDTPSKDNQPSPANNFANSQPSRNTPGKGSNSNAGRGASGGIGGSGGTGSGPGGGRGGGRGQGGKGKL